MDSLKINFDKSYALYNLHKEDLQSNLCYNNIYKLVNTYPELMNTSLIGYGYWGLPSSVFIRHCFLIHQDQVIDPSSFLSVKNHENFKKHHDLMKYYIIASLTTENYKIALEKEEMNPDLKKHLSSQERLFCNYAIQEKLPIERRSYDNYLKKFDPEQKIKIANY